LEREAAKVATQEKRGWTWNPEEKAAIASWRSEVLRKAKAFGEQRERLPHLLPRFAGEVTTLLDPLLSTSKALLALRQERKYLPISPEEAARRFADMRAQEAAWAAFLRRADVQDAIEEVNREQRAARRQQRQAQARALLGVARELETEHFAEMLRASCQRITEVLGATVALGIITTGFGDKKDQPVLERLGLIFFIRAAAAYHRDLKSAVAEYVRSQPMCSIDDLCHFVVTRVAKDQLVADVRGSLIASGPQAAFTLLARDAGSALIAGMRKWKAEGLTPVTLPPTLFTIGGVDFSLARRPT
jgi:hypothetical protein